MKTVEVNLHLLMTSTYVVFFSKAEEAIRKYRQMFFNFKTQFCLVIFEFLKIMPDWSLSLRYFFDKSTETCRGHHLSQRNVKNTLMKTPGFLLTSSGEIW